MEYRLNFFVKLFYAPAYVFVLYLLVNIAYTQTDQLVGWTRHESLLMFGVFHLLYSSCIAFFITSIRYYMWEGFRRGEFDPILLKPVNAQFMATFTRPEFQQLPLMLAMVILIIRESMLLQINPFGLSSLFFLIAIGLSFLIVYFFLTTIMTLGFYVIKAAQILELFDKLADYSQYPTPMFPTTFQAIFFSIIPIAFFAYVPVGILLHKLSLIWVLYSLGMTVTFIIINQFVWKRAIKHYSSASS